MQYFRELDSRSFNCEILLLFTKSGAKPMPLSFHTIKPDFIDLADAILVLHNKIPIIIYTYYRESALEYKSGIMTNFAIKYLENQGYYLSEAATIDQLS
jgi:hypothetical protein